MGIVLVIVAKCCGDDYNIVQFCSNLSSSSATSIWDLGRAAGRGTRDGDSNLIFFIYKTDHCISM